MSPFAAVLWIGCAIVIIRAAWRSRRDPGALRTGRIALGVLYLLGGAAMNALFLVVGQDYAAFADESPISFVRDTWHSVVVPHHEAWIGALIVFELLVGVLALLGGRLTQLAYALAIAFHVALLSFGWGFFLWSLPMIAAFATLLSAEGRYAREVPVAIPRAPRLDDQERDLSR